MEVQFVTGLSTIFLDVGITNSRRGLYGISEDTLYAIKIELLPNPLKNFDLRGEAQIIKTLNERKCRTCVELVHFGDVAGTELANYYQSELSRAIKFDIEISYPMMITRAYPKMSPVCTQDMAMAIIEQKKLGVWNGDITVDDTLLDGSVNCIKLIDYDQAVLLDQEQMAMTNVAFFDWLDEDATARFSQYGVNSFTHNLEVTREGYFSPFFDGDCFDIGKTLLFSSQETTLNSNKIYHSFRMDDVFADGERNLDDRKKYLDKLAMVME